MKEKMCSLKEMIKKGINSAMVLPAAFLAVVASLLWTPMDALGVASGNGIAGISTLFGEAPDSFVRQIGQALVNGSDIDQRITNMSVYGFILIPVLFLLILGVLSLLFRNCETTESGVTFLHRLTAAAFPALAVTILMRLNSTIYSSFSPIVYIAVVVTILYLRFGIKYLPLQEFKWAFFTTVSLLFFGVRFAYLIFPAAMESFLAKNVILMAIYALIFCCVGTAGVFFARSGHSNSLCKATTPIYLAPIFVSIFLETTNILNQYEIYVGHKSKIAFLILILCVLAGAAWYLLRGRKQTEESASNYVKWQYVFLILAMAWTLHQPSLQIQAGTELFETSNHGSDIYALLTDGEIPLVDNLNVHMILEEAGFILYGIFNRDPVGAIWYSYPLFGIATYVVLYALLALITDPENAVLMLLFFPITCIIHLFPFVFGLLPVAGAIYVVKKQDLLADILFVISCALTCLYRADVGLAVCLAAVLSLTVMMIARRDWRALATLWLTGIAGVAVCVCGFFALCLARGVSPLERILQAVSMLMANISWAYSGVAPAYDFRFFLCYLLIPLAITALVGYILLFRNRLKIPTELCMLVAILGLAHYFNFSRGIIRHNLLENMVAFVFGFGVLCILFALWVAKGHKTLMLPVFLSGAVLFQVVWGFNPVLGDTLFQTTVNQYSQTYHYQSYTEKMDRVVIPDQLKQVYEPLKIIFDETLTPEQTYLDYSVDTLLYALVDRDKPVYTNQSPSQLNAEFDQLLFIQEAQLADCPYALCKIGDAGFDGVSQDVKQYLAAEYLNKNYRPLCIVGNYCLWVERDLYEVKKAEVQAVAEEYALGLTFVGETDSFMHRIYQMGEISWLWGKYDNVKDQEVLQQLTEADSEEMYFAGVRITPTETDGVYLFEIKDDAYTQGGTNHRIAVWCSIGDQDDLQWYALNQDNDRFFVEIDIKDHLMQTGEYLIHVYYDDVQGAPFVYTTASQVMELSTDPTEEAKTQFNFHLEPATLDRNDGNYIEIIAEQEENTNATIELMAADGTTVCTVTFNMHSGENRYLIRISGNYLWYTDTIQYLNLHMDQPAEKLSVRILRGDVDYDNMNFLERAVLEN